MTPGEKFRADLAQLEASRPADWRPFVPPPAERDVEPDRYYAPSDETYYADRAQDLYERSLGWD